MKTIAVTIDEPTLTEIDRIARTAGTAPAQTQGGLRRRGGRGASRSEVVRRALAEFVARHEQSRREAGDRAALARVKGKLAKQAAALVDDQAEP